MLPSIAADLYLADLPYEKTIEYSELEWEWESKPAWENTVKCMRSVIEKNCPPELIEHMVNKEAYSIEQMAQSVAKGEYHNTPKENQIEVPRIHNSFHSIASQLPVLMLGVGTDGENTHLYTTIQNTPVVVPVYSTKAPESTYELNLPEKLPYVALPKPEPSKQQNQAPSNTSEKDAPSINRDPKPKQTNNNKSILSPTPSATTTTSVIVTPATVPVVTPKQVAPSQPNSNPIPYDVVAKAAMEGIDNAVPGFKNYAGPKVAAIDAVLDLNNRINQSEQKGHSTTESRVCGVLGTIAKGATGLAAETVVTAATVAAAPETLGGSFAFFAMGSKAAMDLSNQVGDGVTNLCHNAARKMEEDTTPSSNP